MVARELPVPLKRFTEAYDLEIKQRNFIGRWLRYNSWNSAYKEAQEDKLPPVAIKFLDLFNAFRTGLGASPSRQAENYYRVAAILHLLDEDVIELWFKEISREYRHYFAATNEFEHKERWENSHFFHKFCNESGISSYSRDYWRASYSVPGLTNRIRLASALDRHGVPLIFDQAQMKLLLPHYVVARDILTGEEIAEAKGILRLQYAWKTTNEDEKQKIKRFVAVHVNDMDAAINLIESRYVHTLEELDSLMHQTGSTPALSQGAL